MVSLIFFDILTQRLTPNQFSDDFISLGRILFTRMTVLRLKIDEQDLSVELYVGFAFHSEDGEGVDKWILILTGRVVLAPFGKEVGSMSQGE